MTKYPSKFFNQVLVDVRMFWCNLGCFFFFTTILMESAGWGNEQRFFFGNENCINFNWWFLAGPTCDLDELLLVVGCSPFNLSNAFVQCRTFLIRMMDFVKICDRQTQSTSWDSGFMDVDLVLLQYGEPICDFFTRWMLRSVSLSSFSNQC